jgi:hypothetical protein
MAATGDTNQWLFMNNAAGGMIFRWTVPLDPRSTPYNWAGRLVLAPGSRMWISGINGTWAVVASGYILDSP